MVFENFPSGEETEISDPEIKKKTMRQMSEETICQMGSLRIAENMAEAIFSL